MNLPTLDIIIPCYNAESTLARAVESALLQPCSQIILVDDASSDNTWGLMQTFQQRLPEKITALQLANNSGAAMARSFGALHSNTDLVAFLDADDAYQAGALSPIATIFHYLPDLSLLRLRLEPVGLSERFSQHPNFAEAWDMVQMTVGGNMIFRRSVLLACGGFPQDDLFRRLGGEDGALGIALARSTAVGTLFESHHAGVQHYCRDGMHAERLLRASLFSENIANVTDAEMQYAESVTQNIIARLQQTQTVLNHTDIGRRPILIDYGDSG